jgi:hypothetical protein
MITETGFSAGLARVKTKALSGSGRVRLGCASGNRIKAFSLSGSYRVKVGYGKNSTSG